MKLSAKMEFILITDEGYRISDRIIELLKVIHKTGSLNTAVKELGVSYSHAWNTLNQLNCRLETDIVITRRGGNGGGVSTLTDAGLKLIKQYDDLSDEVRKLLLKRTIDLN
ncbi:MAG: LysR family transcriptional regulator [Spirochaetes bacterium]|nr:LysR family transcriptional regulator [Spirochaetota bacterium]